MLGTTDRRIMKLLHGVTQYFVATAGHGKDVRERRALMVRKQSDVLQLPFRQRVD